MERNTPEWKSKRRHGLKEIDRKWSKARVSTTREAALKNKSK